MFVGGTVISSVEFHGNMSLVIFMSGCPLCCRFCHNVELINDHTEVTLEEICEEIDSSKDFLDAIVISGGEPLLQTEAVKEILKYVKQLNLKTKLDTSGIYPEELDKLLKEDLIDFVSLDIKAPFEDYRHVVGEDVGEDVKNSMEIINSYGVTLETRTTVVPTLHKDEDIRKIASSVKSDIYTIQQFRNKNVLDPALEHVDNPNAVELTKLAESLKDYFDGTIKVKTAEFGAQVIN
ncbi:MAG: anaerobic ribonucleoside-triphosphate reductase activating protein [Methanobrevibacter sp.]|uniref:anaerobic ribonucleoside-triphosphate reductase activating protein n=1 Tax=Methanobrevibacter sp. TaxID=66852 RepID=UPI0026DF291D|nr:anaerobic ribonucleoside-triphosphate reductase activating protein [Methanobrevibacter sp.]MDO5848475.1 anaerobic ribonucleoside-triphosphate reductase activating protein [Methanobrevibacter sp.]